MERRPPATIPDTDGASAPSVITRRSNHIVSATGQQLNELQSALATLTTKVSSQASTMTTITNQVTTGHQNRDGGSGKRTLTVGKKPKEKHTCTKCKLLVLHKEEKCPDYEPNADKCLAGWKNELK